MPKVWHLYIYGDRLQFDPYLIAILSITFHLTKQK